MKHSRIRTICKFVRTLFEVRRTDRSVIRSRDEDETEPNVIETKLSKVADEDR